MNRSRYWRRAMWSAVVAIAAPVLYFVFGLTLEATGSKDTAFLFAWLLVLPMFLAVAIGSVCLVVFVLLALFAKPMNDDRGRQSKLDASK